ncbi:MAG: MFS transporter [Planctomycetia bacterium]|nr:MFS transporter [Planctomycetia bacterium]
MTDVALPLDSTAEQARYRRYRWQIFAVTWLIYAAFYLIRKSFSVATVAFVDPLAHPVVSFPSHDVKEDFANINLVFLTTYAIGQFLWGPIGDRIGPRRVLITGVGLCLLAGLAAGWATTYWAFIVFAIVHGMGQSAGWTNIAKTMSSWFSLSERGRVMGWWSTSYAIGDAVPLAGMMMLWFGHPRPAGLPGEPTIPYWPAGFWGPAAIVAVVFVLVCLFLRSRPEDVGLPSVERFKGEPESVLVEGESPAEEPDGSWKVLGEVLRTPAVWALGIAYFSIKLARYFLMMWGGLYVKEMLGQDSGVFKSIIATTVIPIGAIIGIVLTGYISDRCFQSRRIPISVISLSLTVAVMFLGLGRIPQMWLLCVFFFLIGLFLFGPDSILSGAAAMDFGTKKGAGTATGIVNGIGAIGGILGGYLPGKLAKNHDWSPLFICLIVGLIISILVILPWWKSLPPTAAKN